MKGRRSFGRGAWLGAGRRSASSSRFFSPCTPRLSTRKLRFRTGDPAMKALTFRLPVLALGARSCLAPLQPFVSGSQMNSPAAAAIFYDDGAQTERWALSGAGSY